jgi:outer membrane protein assembly factor BamB
MKIRRIAFAGLMALTLAGCGTTASNLLDFGASKDKPLSGTRETVLPEGNAGEAATPAEPIAIPAAMANAGWPQSGGNASHNLQHLQLGGELNKLFAADAGAGSNKDGRLTAPPIVDNGRIYVMDTQATVTGFDAAGKRLWRTSTVPKGEDGDGAYGGGIASDGQRIYAATAFGEIVALNAGDGKEVWRKKVDVPVRTAPTVENGRIYFVTVTNDVYAMNAADGTELWRYQGTGEAASALSSTSPAVAGDLIVAPTTSGDLIGISASSGLPLWVETLTALDTSTGLANLNDISARPVIDGSTAYALSHTGRFAAFDGKTGQRIWERSIAGTETPWAAGSALYVISRDSKLQAISAKTGGSWWIKSMPEGTWAGPVLAGNRLIAVSNTGLLASFSPQTGELLGTQKLGGKFYIAPVVANGTVYLLSDSADLIALR